MGESLDQLWYGFWTLAGAHFVGFMTLTGWIYTMQKKVSEAIKLEKNIIEINNNIREMRGAIIGDFKEKGIITRQREIEKRVAVLEASK